MLEIFDSRDCYYEVFNASLPTVSESTYSFNKYLLEQVMISLTAMKKID